MEDKRKPLWKRWWVWLIALIVIIVIASCSSGDQTTEPTQPEESQEVTQPEPEPEPDEAEEVVGEPTQKVVEEEDVELIEGAEGEDLSNKAFEQLVLTILQDNFEGLAEVELVQEEETFYITSTDIQFTLELADVLEGKPSAIADWDFLVDSFRELSEAVEDLLPGYWLSVRNPVNPDNVILIVSDGVVIYNFTDE